MNAGDVPWRDEYFAQDYFEEYGTGHQTDAQAAAEAEFAASALGLSHGAQILDLACGYGRHAVELAARGYEVMAVDLSPFLLERARQRATERGATIRTAHADMRELAFSCEFDAVISMFTSFGLLPDDEDVAVLRGISAGLKPEGKLLLDLDNAAKTVREFQDQFWRRLPRGGFALSEGRYDARTGRIEGTRVHIDRSGDVREYRMSLRVYTHPEIVRLLSEMRLSVVDTWGDFDGRPYDLQSRRMIVVAQASANRGTP